MLRNKKEVPANALRFTATDAAIAIDEDGKFSMTPYAGQQFEHAWWGKMVFDVESLNMRKKTIPALYGHDWSKPVGVIKSMSKDKNKVSVSGEFIDNEESKELLAMKEKGLDWECSLAFGEDTEVEYVREDAVAEVNGEKFEGPGHIMKGGIHEVSFTHYGAVPGTETDFSKNDKKVKVFFNNFCEESGMSENNISQADLDQKREEGKTEVQALFSKMNETCSDKEFVADCFAKGLNFEQFQAELVTKLQGDLEAKDAKIVELQAKVDEVANTDNRPEVEFAAGEQGTERGFKSIVKDIMVTEKCGYSKAYSKAIKENPEKYREFKNSCPVSK